MASRRNGSGRKMGWAGRTCAGHANGTAARSGGFSPARLRRGGQPLFPSDGILDTRFDPGILFVDVVLLKTALADRHHDLSRTCGRSCSNPIPPGQFQAQMQFAYAFGRKAGGSEFCPNAENFRISFGSGNRVCGTASPARLVSRSRCESKLLCKRLAEPAISARNPVESGNQVFHRFLFHHVRKCAET